MVLTREQTRLVLLCDICGPESVGGPHQTCVIASANIPTQREGILPSSYEMGN